MYRDVAHAVYKRGEAHFEGYELPSWTPAVVLLDIIVLLPLILLFNYTLQNIVPTLLVVEDPSPPAYEPISLNDDDQSLAEENVPKLANERAAGAETRAITSSLRTTLRTLKSISGWTSLFRGLGLHLLIMWIIGLFGVVGIKTMSISSILLLPLAGITVLRLSTAWVHIVISAPSPKRFWHRLPPFVKTLKATMLPIVLVFLAMGISHIVPDQLGRLLGVSGMDNNGTPQVTPADVWKVLLCLATTILLQIFLVIPAQVTLTRVQASMLPEEDDTIIPFDRSFQGKLEPAIVGGNGYISVRDAWATFSRASWVRLVKLYAKIFAISIAFGFLMGLVIVSEVILVLSCSKKIE